MLQSRPPFCLITAVAVAFEASQVWGDDPAHDEIQRAINLAAQAGVGLDKPSIGGLTRDPDGWRLVEGSEGQLFERALVFDAYARGGDLLFGEPSIGEIIMTQYRDAAGVISDVVSWTGTTYAVEDAVRAIRSNSTTPEA